MIPISNSDYHTARRLLRHLATTKGQTLREENAARQAGQLLRKWERKDGNCVVTFKTKEL